MILFTLFNTFQRPFIFLFICMISSDARDEARARVFNFMKLIMKTYFSQGFIYFNLLMHMYKELLHMHAMSCKNINSSAHDFLELFMALVVCT